MGKDYSKRVAIKIRVLAYLRNYHCARIPDIGCFIKTDSLLELEIKVKTSNCANYNTSAI